MEKILNYEIVRKIGEGGMGQVFLASNPAIGQLVAIKMLNPRYGNNPELRERFRREARMLSEMNHPNIVKFLNYVENDEGVYLIMEYVEGLTLEDYIHSKNGLLVENKAVPMIEKLLSAFSYAHMRGIVHRDIKPNNIIIDPHGNPRILDFGIAQIISDVSDDRRERKAGSTAYMSPEQVLEKHADMRSDIYSLGVVMYEMLTGRAPYDTKKLSVMQIKEKILKEPLPRLKEAYPYISDDMQRVVDKATAKNPAARYDTCDRMSRDLHPKEKKPSYLWAIITAVAVVAVVAGIGIWLWSKEQVRTSYYADYIEENELPVGIGELTPEQVAKRQVTYRIDTKKGKVIRLTRVNSADRPFNEDLGLLGEFLPSNFIDIEYVYDKEGNLEKKNYFDATGQTLFTLEFEDDYAIAHAIGRDGESAVNPIKQLLGPEKAIEMGVHPDATTWLIDRDGSGRVKTIVFADAGGKPLSVPDGRAGLRFGYDSEGRLVEYGYVDTAKKPALKWNAYATARLIYDSAGRFTEIEYLGKDGKKINIPGVAATIKLTRNEDGNLTKENYFDGAGNPVKHPLTGAIGRDNTFDDHGFMTESTPIMPVAASKK